MVAVLEQILRMKRTHIERCKADVPHAALKEKAQQATPPKGFARTLRRRAADGEVAVIAEVKKASPSKGLIREDFDPLAIADSYQTHGAACLSVLTDEPFFQGRDAYLEQIAAAVSLPCLRKDFMLDSYQVTEARALGADCILLILAALEDETAGLLERAALDLGMDVLIEVHDEAEMRRALTMESRLIGINNRNLKTMEVSLATTERLALLAPEDALLVCESGITTREDIARARAAGAQAFLIGEHFMRQNDPGMALKELLA